MSVQDPWVLGIDFGTSFTVAAARTRRGPEVIEIGGAHLDAEGYDLLGLIIGSEGQFGIVTEATLELVNRPEAEFSAFWLFREYDDAWRTLGDVARSGWATIATQLASSSGRVVSISRSPLPSLR